ncbi:MAG: endonuclease III [Candidatus Micrarchaeia archaeon]
MIVREAKRNGAPVLKIGDFTKGDKFKSLVFTILSARTKDETTLKACEKLFSRVRGPWELAGMKRGNVAKLIYGVGFYRQKAGYLIEMANQLVYDFDAKVPSDFEKLMKLPGVGRKTANVVLAHAFGKDAIGVDVHVHRISNRLGIVKTKKPEKTEEKLKLVVPKRLWKHLNIVLVAHGQTTCLPKVPLCSRCVIRRYCKQVGVKKSA